MAQNEITASTRLLSDLGSIRRPGYARSGLQIYAREDVKSPGRLRERDTYLICGGQTALELSFAEYGSTGILTATVMDLEKNTVLTARKTRALLPRREHLPDSCEEGDVRVSGSDLSAHFLHTAPGERTIIVQWKGFAGGDSLSARLTLREEESESLAVAIPFREQGEFSYSRTLPALKADGYVTVGSDTRTLTDAAAILSWDRGVWPKKSDYVRCEAAGADAGGRTFALRLGGGYGEDREATENMVFVSGRGHKLGRVAVAIPGEDEGRPRLTESWTLKDRARRLNMTFTPALTAANRTALPGKYARQTRVFGFFSGTVELDDESVAEVRELPGFAELTEDKW